MTEVLKLKRSCLPVCRLAVLRLFLVIIDEIKFEYHFGGLTITKSRIEILNE